MKIQSTIAGFAGQPTTIIGSLDERTGVLVMVKEVKFREERIDETFALVSNLNLPELDFRFGDDHLGSAIRTYFTRRAQTTIDIMQELQRHLPDNKIESDAVDEGGRRYRIHPEIMNGQIAILAAVALCEKQDPFNAAMQMQEELIDFYRVTSI